MSEAAGSERLASTLRDALGGNELSILMDFGKAWSEEQAVAEAFALSGIDTFAQGAGD